MYSTTQKLLTTRIESDNSFVQMRDIPFDARDFSDPPSRTEKTLLRLTLHSRSIIRRKKSERPEHYTLRALVMSTASNCRKHAICHRHELLHKLSSTPLSDFNTCRLNCLTHIIILDFAPDSVSSSTTDYQIYPRRRWTNRRGDQRPRHADGRVRRRTNALSTICFLR